jgi:hypothetical protein
LMRRKSIYNSLHVFRSLSPKGTNVYSYRPVRMAPDPEGGRMLHNLRHTLNLFSFSRPNTPFAANAQFLLNCQLKISRTLQHTNQHRYILLFIKHID